MNFFLVTYYRITTELERWINARQKLLNFESTNVWFIAVLGSEMTFERF